MRNIREKSRGMDAMQLLVTTIIRSSANQVLLTRLNSLRLTASNSRFLRKMDEFGVTFDEMVKKGKAVADLKHQVSSPPSSSTAVVVENCEQFKSA